MSIAEDVRNYQDLVTDAIVDHMFIPHRELKYIDKPDEFVRTVVAHPVLRLTEEDGCIVELTYKIRQDLMAGGQAEVYRDDLGREVTSTERANLPPQGQARLGTPYKVWDAKVTKVTETDGPEQRRILLQTHEQNKLEAREDKARAEDSQKQLADAISKLAGAVEPMPEPKRRGRKIDTGLDPELDK